jgi:hypothetical protein
MAPSLKAALLGCAIAFSPLFGNSEAQPACYPMPQIEEMAQKYKELPVSYGKAEGGWTLTIWASEDGKTWTALMVSPDGRLGCTIPGVHGTEWVPGELAGKGV